VIRHGPVLLSVWSDGAPLDPVVESHLFEPFSSSESRSSGLGLYICRELCERHGAELAHERTVRVRAGSPWRATRSASRCAGRGQFFQFQLRGLQLLMNAHLQRAARRASWWSTTSPTCARCTS
jgi:signal transduction histidine kinase